MKNLIEQLNKTMPVAVKRKTEITYWLERKTVDYPKNLSGSELMNELRRRKNTDQRADRTFRAYARFWDSFSQAEERLKELGMSYSGETSGWAAMVLGILAYFDRARGINPDTIQLRSNVATSEATRRIDYFVFICPPINTTPDGAGYYIYPNPERTAIYTERGASYRQLVGWLKYAGAIPNLLVFIGDTDDTDYIYPAIGSPERFSWDERTKQIVKMKMYIYKLVARKIQQERTVLSWYLDMPQKLEDVSVNRPDITISEQPRIRELFSDGNFYGEMIRPTGDQVSLMAALKVNTYGFQGREIRGRYNPTFGIQTETPSLLRSEMLNALTNDCRLPFIYPYIFRP